MDSTVEVKYEIDVEFIKDEDVVYIIKDDILRNRSNVLNGTSKHITETACSSRVSIKSKKDELTQGNISYGEELSENELDVVPKPQALFEIGDVPGGRIFSFNLKQKKPSTNTSCFQKTPNSKKKCTENAESPLLKKSQQDLFDIENESDSRASRNSTKATSKSSTLKSQKALSDNVLDSQYSSDNKYGFETPGKSKHKHCVKSYKNQCDVENIPSIYSTPKTSKLRKRGDNENMLTKTPRAVRKQIAKGIAHQKFEQLNELNDSDYSISDKSVESDSDSSNHSNAQTEDLKVNDIPLRRSTRKKEVSYVYKSDDYFLSKSTKSLKKSKTSDNTLKLLKNPALEKEQVDQLSRNSNTIHDKKFKAMYKEIVSNFPYWLCLLKEGFNVLLYGLGSKRQIINDFRSIMLEKESVLVINGFFPGLTLKEILESISIDLLGLENCPGSVELAFHQIEEKQKLKNADHIYILVHNLDGVELQNFKIQHIFSRICSLKNIHLIASIDRVNAALMFDNTKLGNYNFIWMDCTNYSPYTIETDFIQSLMVKNIGTQHTFSGLNNVYKSLTSNAKRILLLLIKNRIDNKNDKKFDGIPFSVLYRWCRQRFLVSTDLALRSQLTEFVDHELVKWKRDADVLYVPVDVDVLIKFYKLNEEDDE